MELRHIHVTEERSIAAEIGLGDAAVRNGLAADEGFPHRAIMALGTDSCAEIDARAMFGAIFCAGVDLEAE
jgi:hypothetical protein